MRKENIRVESRRIKLMKELRGEGVVRNLYMPSWCRPSALARVIAFDFEQSLAVESLVSVLQMTEPSFKKIIWCLAGE